MVRSLAPIAQRAACVLLLTCLHAVLPATAQDVAWTRHHDGGAAATDSFLGCVDDLSIPTRPGSMVRDAAGNLYAVGCIKEGVFSPKYDVLTVKYDASGGVVWARRLTNAVYRQIATVVAVDGAGNVYVAGSRWINAPDESFLTVKYDAAGNLQWSAVYAAPGSGFERPQAIAVDAAGNVVVTGYSRGSTSNYDYTTVKYSPTGTQLWVARYDGPGSAFDRAYGLGLDAAGNVYVTGRSQGATQIYEPTTVKYDPDGNVSWVRRFVAPFAEHAGAEALILGAAGDVHVVGWAAGPGGTTDYLTIKYDAAGTQLWAAFYDGPLHGTDVARAVALDAAGNVHVTGDSDGEVFDYATVKYDALGNQVWAARTSGLPGDGQDYAYAIAVDAAGAVYVTGEALTGSSYATADALTVKYDASGAEVWARRYAGPSGGRDRGYNAWPTPSGVVVAGTSFAGANGSDFWLIAYDDAGTLWQVSEPAMGAWTETAVAVRLDPAGNVYVAGNTTPPVGASDYLLVKLDAAGNVLWSRRYDAGGADTLRDLAVDAQGNAYVTGTSSVGSNDDYATVKYAPDGTQLWVGRFDAGNYDQGSALLVDGLGHVYVTGRSATPATSHDVLTVKYDAATGSELWNRRYAGLGGAHNGGGNALALDGAGNLLVAGSERALSPTNSDVCLIKYDPAGNQVWVAHYAGPAGGEDYGSRLALDGAGNAYVASQSWGGSAWDTATVKFTADGTVAWVNRYAAQVPSALVVDAAGDVYVAGGGLSAFTVKYSASGGQLWLVNGAGTSARMLALDEAAGVYMPGSGPPAGNIDVVTRKYDSSGLPLWLARYDGPTHGYDTGAALAVVAPGDVIVVGTSRDPASLDDLVVIRYVESTTAQADLAVTKSDGQASTVPGQATTYTVTVTNAGPAAAPSVTVEDVPPAACAPAGWTCSGAGGGTCTPQGSGAIRDLASLPVGGSATYLLSCPIDPAATGTLSNNAAVFSAVAGDPAPGNNAATDVNALTPLADLGLALSDDRDPMPVRGTVTYTAALSNAGPSDAAGAQLALVLPAGFTFVESTPGAPTCQHAAGTVTCGLGTLAAAGGAQVNVTAQAQQGTLGGVTATAQVSAATTDPDGANNGASESTTVVFVKGDLDDDLSPELLLRHTVTNDHVAWVMDGTTQRYETSLIPSAPVNPGQRIAGVDDFDGDQRNDLVVWDEETGAVEFWLMNGFERIGNPVPLSGAPTLAPNWKLSATGDFNGDGHPDLVWRNFTSQKIVIWTMNGTAKVGSIIPTPDQAVHVNWEIAAALDFNGDGQRDFLWYNWDSGKIVLWFMDASVARIVGQFTTPANAGDNNWKVLAGGDYGVGPNGSAGTNDIVWRNASSGRFVVWHMDLAGNRTGGVFTLPDAPPTDPTLWTITGPR